MHASARPRPYPPHRAIAGLIDRHGPWAILRAVVSEMLRHKRQRPAARRPVSDHLRRDIGVSPLASPPPMRLPPF